MGYGEAKKKKRKVSDGTLGLVDFLRSCGIGAAASVLAALVLSVLATVVAFSQSDPDALVSVLAFLSVYIASFAGGFVSSKLYRERGVAAATVSGAMFAFLLLFVSVFAKNAVASDNSFAVTLALRASIVAASAVGGAVGRYKRQKRRSWKRGRHLDITQKIVYNCIDVIIFE